jgi:SAM-dependent methyltransferase
MAEERWIKAQDAEKNFWNGFAENVTNWEDELSLLKKHNIETKDKKLLEIGGAANGILTALEGDRYSIEPLVDFFLSKGTLAPNINYINGKGEALPFQDSFFDIVFCLNVLDHSDQPNKILDESYRCLKNDGIFFMSLNCYDKKIVNVKRFAENIGAGDICHPYTYSIEDIKKDIIDHGFEIIDMQMTPPLYYKKTAISIANNPKEPFFKKLIRVIKLRGLSYIFKRAFIIPIHMFVLKVYNYYPEVNFICKKVEKNDK